jgi:hypothetical protein
LTAQAFRLVPYPAEELPALEIKGEFQRIENRLSIRFIVTGDVEAVFVPEVAVDPARKHDLWRTTCFEFFLAPQGEPRYWEVNLSPSGAWNVYAMDAYRQVNMREERAMSQVEFQFQKTEAGLSVVANVDLSPLVSADVRLELGITAIIHTLNGHESFWALAHPGPHADFHLRESFQLTC